MIVIRGGLRADRSATRRGPGRLLSYRLRQPTSASVERGLCRVICGHSLFVDVRRGLRGSGHVWSVAQHPVQSSPLNSVGAFKAPRSLSLRLHRASRVCQDHSRSVANSFHGSSNSVAVSVAREHSNGVTHELGKISQERG